MIDRDLIKEFLDLQLADIEIEIPKDICVDVLIETFYKYVENDSYEWFKDNFKSFFNNGNPDWDWIRNRVEQYCNVDIKRTN